MKKENKIGALFYHPKFGVLTVSKKRYSPLKNKVVWYAKSENGKEIELTDEKPLNNKEVEQYQFIQGQDGLNGRDPIKGVDYFTDEEIEEFKQKITPKKGKDYFDGAKGDTPVKGKDYFTEREIKEFVKKSTPIKNLHYFDGEKGDTGEKGDKPDHKWEGTKLKFEKPNGKWGEAVDLKGKDGLNGGGGNSFNAQTSVSASDRQPGYLEEKIKAGANITITKGTGLNEDLTISSTSNVSEFTDLTDVPSSYAGGASKAVYVKADETGLEFKDAVSSDEKVKYDASDPNAGYVADKVIAGTGISVAEGTGADENKLQITNSAPDQTVAITGAGISTISGTYPNFTVTSTEADTLDTVTDRGNTTDNKIFIGADASATDFPKAQAIFSAGDSGHTYAERVGVVGESIGSPGTQGIGVVGVAKTQGYFPGIGVFGRGIATSADTGGSVGVQGEAVTTHAGGSNVAFKADAQNGATNYSFYGLNGKILNTDNIETLASVVEGVPTLLKLDQTTPQTIINGFPEYEDGHAEFDCQHCLVDKEYVDSAVLTLGARFYMLDAADSSVATYKQTAMSASALATASVSASVDAETDTLIEEWISPSTMTFETLQSGVYDLDVYAAKTAGNRAVRIFWRFYERLADNSEVLISQSALSELVTTKARFRVYSALSSDYTPSVGSRLVGKVYMNTVGGSQNTTTIIYYQGDEDSHWQIPANEAFLDDNFLKLDQTTPQTITNGAPIFSANISTPKVIGGSETTSDLSLQTTSGVGTTGADMHFLVGNNGATEAMTILNAGYVGIGTNAPTTVLHVPLSGVTANDVVLVGAPTGLVGSPTAGDTFHAQRVVASGVCRGLVTGAETSTSATEGANTRIQGLNAFASTSITSTGNIPATNGGLRNNYGTYHYGSGIIATAYAVNGISNVGNTSNNNAGIVTSAVAFNAQNPVFSAYLGTAYGTMTSYASFRAAGGAITTGGTLTNRYGLLIEDLIGGTNRWGIYQTGVSDSNYFGGAVGVANSITSTHATAGIGYATGAGGTITQATNRTTGVTLNKICGAITLVSAAGSTTWQSFTLTNSAIAATDTIIINQKSGTDLYEIHITAVGAGSCRITFKTTGGTTTEQPVFNFSVIKAVTA